MIKPHTALLTMICLLSLTGCAGISSQSEPKLVTESYLIQSRDPGVQLYVRNKRPQYMTAFSPEKTLLYVHGSTQALETTFDLQLDGLSWMDYVAQRGYDVYLVLSPEVSQRTPSFTTQRRAHSANFWTDLCTAADAFARSENEC